MASSWPGSQSRMILRGWVLLAAEVLIPQVCHAHLGERGAKARILLTRFHTPRILRAQPPGRPLFATIAQAVGPVAVQILFPLVLIILGVVILVQGHAFGL